MKKMTRSLTSDLVETVEDESNEDDITELFKNHWQQLYTSEDTMEHVEVIHGELNVKMLKSSGTANDHW